jgi:hypothetical protein
MEFDGLLPCSQEPSLVRESSPHTLLHAASYTMGTGVSFLRGKAAKRGADHYFPSSAEVKNGGSIAPLRHTSSWRSA